MCRTIRERERERRLVAQLRGFRGHLSGGREVVPAVRRVYLLAVDDASFPPVSGPALAVTSPICRPYEHSLASLSTGGEIAFLPDNEHWPLARMKTDRRSFLPDCQDSARKRCGPTSRNAQLSLTRLSEQVREQAHLRLSTVGVRSWPAKSSGVQFASPCHPRQKKVRHSRTARLDGLHPRTRGRRTRGGHSRGQ